MAQNTPEFAILGAGALGSIIGAHLARAGHSVLMLARGQRARDIESDGLRIRGLTEFTQRVPVLTEPSRFAAAEVLIIATKAIGTAATLDTIRNAKVQSVFSVQNGVMKNEHLTAAWGPAAPLGALADTSGELLTNGEVLFTRNQQLYIGEIGGGQSVRAQRIAAAMDAAGVRTAAVADIDSLEWSKFAAWTGLMSLSVATRAETWKFLCDRDLALILARLVREIASLAAARDVALSDRSPLPVATLAACSEMQAVALIQAAGEQLKAAAPEHRMSTLQDLNAGRALEVDETLGYAASEAARLNVEVPLLRTICSLVDGIGRSRLA